MAQPNGRTTWLDAMTGSLVVRLVVYYAILVTAMTAVWRFLPHSEAIARRTRLMLEPLLEEHLKRWRYGGVVHEDDGTDMLEYAVALKKSVPLEQLLAILKGRLT